MGRRKTHEEFVAEVEALVGDEYTFKGRYTNGRTKMNVVHEECGHRYEVVPDYFLAGSRCPSCANKHRTGRNRKSQDEFVRRVIALVDNEYKVVGEYLSTMSPLKMRHNTCGHEYNVRPCNFLQGRRCPKCASSKGEKAVSDCLERRNIQFTSQLRYADCRDKYTLPFDFGIIVSSEVVGLIEYDGKQHFEAIDAWGGGKALRETQRRDAIKTKYCADNNIPLLRIPYTDYANIEAIVANWVTSFGGALQAA